MSEVLQYVPNERTDEYSANIFEHALDTVGDICRRRYKLLDGRMNVPVVEFISRAQESLNVHAIIGEAAAATLWNEIRLSDDTTILDFVYGSGAELYFRCFESEENWAAVCERLARAYMHMPIGHERTVQFDEDSDGFKTNPSFMHIDGAMIPWAVNDKSALQRTISRLTANPWLVFICLLTMLDSIWIATKPSKS